MAWEQLSINKPHLVYLILGGFTSLFMLCSSVIKERLYIGEATVATICGIIFGPHAANLIDPNSWGNVDQITLEFSRIVLVVQCFAVGVELPKAYMERHWRSVVLLLVPVMTFGWLITSLFIWGLVPSLNWLDSLVVAACVTATDPVLASSVVGKGKFAKRVPKHIRDLLSAESGCNDGMAFPFIYLGLYLIKYRPHASEVFYHWFCFTVLYECIFGAVYGFLVGYLARRAIRYAHEKNLIDRESFLVFYFVLALFCAGSGSLLGLDDLLVGFACGVGFSNDGWFTEKTEESHVSNVIDLLINLAFFVYFGAIIPWEQFNAENVLGLTAWRLAVIAILVLLFRRIPIMLALKPIIPDMKTWREAVFSGHFGPIGVGAIFVAILARAELETDTTTPLAVLPEVGFPHLNIIELIWPITTFLVICSIVVHGSSIAVFTLGKHINTLSLTMSYTQGNDTGWMDRLPRIQSRSRTSMSLNRNGDSESALNEKFDLPTGVVPKNFLRRQPETDSPSRSSSRRPQRRKKESDYRGPISQSAIAPIRSSSNVEEKPSMNRSDSDTLAQKNSDESREGSTGKTSNTPPSERAANGDGEIYEEGDQTIYEDEDGNVMEVEDEDASDTDAQRHAHERKEVEKLMERTGHVPGSDQTREKAEAEPKPEHASPSTQHHWRLNLGTFRGLSTRGEKKPKAEASSGKKSGPARAYQYGNTIIVEDEDGEVIKKYDINPPAAKKEGQTNSFTDPAKTRERMHRMGSYLGVRPKDVHNATTGQPVEGKKDNKKKSGDEEDDGVRFTVEAGGRRMSKAEFIQQIAQLDPKSRARVVEQASVPEAVKEEARKDAQEHDENARRASRPEVKVQGKSRGSPEGGDHAEVKRVPSHQDAEKGPEGLTLVDSNDNDVPFHDVTGDLHRYTVQQGSSSETAAQRRRREASERAAAVAPEDDDSEDDGTERVPMSIRPGVKTSNTGEPEEETAAERRRREGALGIRHDESEESEEETPAASPMDERVSPVEQEPGTSGRKASRGGTLSPTREVSDEEDEAEGEDVLSPASSSSRPGIRFADNPAPQRDPSASSAAKRRPRHWR